MEEGQALTVGVDHSSQSVGSVKRAERIGVNAGKKKGVLWPLKNEEEIRLAKADKPNFLDKPPWTFEKTSD